ncbi:MAG: hypothetical protein WCD75_08115, partial [Rhodoplanes sp.]
AELLPRLHQRPPFVEQVTTPVSPLSSAANRMMRIPTEAGRAYRFDAGHVSELMSATIPI